MPADFADRVAALEEHIVVRDTSSDEFLARAEQALAEGDRGEARHCLTMAKIGRDLEEIKALNDEADWGDDDA
jgi:hypothetical protein